MKKQKDEKEKITRLIADTLKADARVLFAYLYGSFVTGGAFRDIDLFLFLKTPEDPFRVSVDIRELLAGALTAAGLLDVPADFFDVRVMNDAPYDFVINILCDGLLLVDRDPEIRTDLIEKVSNEYRVNCALLDEVFR
ncbi:MAG: nucleotidyltransferase domain-containing protein [Deltaproteobacteria bacterium]|nr:nucleotidyltransferase domain-containing protein [Deltaproteobacteria bacterium]